MKESVLRTKSKEFAKDIIFLCRKMKNYQVEHALVNQLLRSGTSVGAKECNESDYWIDLLFETNSMEQMDYDQLKSKIVELRRMLVASVTTVKQKHNQEKTK